jgi:hypothetical protein
LDINGIERLLEPSDLDMVYPVNINPIVLGNGIGIYIDGARTLSTDPDFMFVSTRRVFISYRAKAQVGLLFAASIIGCGARAVNIPLTNYKPMLTGDYDVYKGQRVYLMNFENQAGDTSMWAYSSPDKKFSYSNDSLLENYFWYAFERAFIAP